MIFIVIERSKGKKIPFLKMFKLFNPCKGCIVDACCNTGCDKIKEFHIDISWYTDNNIIRERYYTFSHGNGPYDTYLKEVANKATLKSVALK